MRHIEGIASIRTSLRQHVHSLPPTHRSPHLERHLLAKDRERLVEEIARLERRCYQCRQRLADIEAKLASVADREDAGRTAFSPAVIAQRVPSRLAKMTVEY
jgi:uncharacterized membrane protein YccC